MFSKFNLAPKPTILCVALLAASSRCHLSFAQESAAQSVKGTVATTFKPDSNIWFIVSSTRFIPTNDDALITQLKDMGFVSSTGGYVRTRNRGTEWVVGQSGYRQLRDEKPIQAKVTINYRYFSGAPAYTVFQLVGKNGGWIDQVWQEPITKTQREFTGNKVRGVIGWHTEYSSMGGVPYTAPTYGWVDEYVDRKITLKPGRFVNKIVSDSYIPNSPFALPSKISVGTTLKFTIEGVPDIRANWRVTRLYKQGNSTFAEGQLKSVNEAITILSGILVVRINDGVLEHLNAQMKYPKGEIDNSTYGEWHFHLQADRVSKDRYQQAQKAEERRWATLGTSSAVWDSSIAENRIVGLRWTIKGSGFVVKFGANRTFTITLDGKKKWPGTWKIVNRSIYLEPKYWSQDKGTFAFALNTQILEPDDDAKGLLEFFESALHSS